jgi:glycosyltransferase involved in cell wall biosynthesis
MLLRQMLLNPLQAIAHPNAVYAFPGYPPSPLFLLMRHRCVLYVHDLFLLDRRSELNRSAKHYMAPMFRIAIRHLRYFLVNSEATRTQLIRQVPRDAEIILYRPRVTNVFGLRVRRRRGSCNSRPLVVGALGTIEPRKNFVAAARICQALAQQLAQPVELHIIGRRGWGGDYDTLSRMDNVRLHGFLADEDAGSVIGSFDFFLCTSHDEGLGLPLLEMQYAGIPVVAPDQDVFREVLEESGTFISPEDPERAAEKIGALLRQADWRERAAQAATANLARWNNRADADRSNVIDFLSGLCSGRSRSS